MADKPKGILIDGAFTVVAKNDYKSPTTNQTTLYVTIDSDEKGAVSFSDPDRIFDSVPRLEKLQMSLAVYGSQFGNKVNYKLLNASIKKIAGV